MIVSLRSPTRPRLGVAERRRVRRVGIDARPVVGAGERGSSSPPGRRAGTSRGSSSAAPVARSRPAPARRRWCRRCGGRRRRRRRFGRVADLDDVAVAHAPCSRRRALPAATKQTTAATIVAADGEPLAPGPAVPGPCVDPAAAMTCRNLPRAAAFCPGRSTGTGRSRGTRTGEIRSAGRSTASSPSVSSSAVIVERVDAGRRAAASTAPPRASAGAATATPATPARWLAWPRSWPGGPARAPR